MKSSPDLKVPLIRVQQRKVKINLRIKEKKKTCFKKSVSFDLLFWGLWLITLRQWFSARDGGDSSFNPS